MLLKIDRIVTFLQHMWSMWSSYIYFSHKARPLSTCNETYRLAWIFCVVSNYTRSISQVSWNVRIYLNRRISYHGITMEGQHYFYIAFVLETNNENPADINNIYIERSLNCSDILYT